jgi:tRNA (guanine-N(7)-)-methyltransferase subunit TRM82
VLPLLWFEAAMPPVARVSSSSLIVAFDTQINVYSFKKVELIKSIKIPEIQSDHQNANKITTSGKAAAKGSPDPLTIIACSLSPDEDVCCVADSHKRLLMYETSSWSLIRQVSTERKVSLITFDSSGRRVLVADRTGDVYLIDCSDENAEPRVSLLMGHLSIILSLVITYDDRFIVTADRDEKIRVSRFPNSYNIQSYCLGHREFVSTVVIMKNDTLISGSGDGTIRMWKLSTGQLISFHDCGPDHNVKQIVSVCNGMIAVSFYCMKSVTIYELKNEYGPRFTKHRVINVPAEVLNMEVWNEDSLILLMRSSDQPLRLIRLVVDAGLGDESSDEELDERKRGQALMKCINRVDELRAVMKQGSDADELKLLKKEAYDNVNQYLLRKQERLENQKHHPLPHLHQNHDDDDHEDDGDADAIRKKTRLNHSPSSTDQPVPAGIPKLE